MLHRDQLEIFLSAILVLLVRFCNDIKEHADGLESNAPPGRNATTSDLTNENH